MSNHTRRDLLKNLALSAATAGLTVAEAQHVHQMAADDKATTGGVYKPKAFTPNEYATMRRMCDMIFPGAVEGGAPEFIDLLSSNNVQLKAIYTGGFAWVDH